jgi:hypothetical protein
MWLPYFSQFGHSEDNNPVFVFGPITRIDVEMTNRVVSKSISSAQMYLYARPVS